MAKVPFSKLQAVINNEVSEIIAYNKAGEAVPYEVKHYLPYQEKIELVSNVINNSVDDNGYYNPMRVKLFLTLETVYAYTNLNFTEKQKEDPFKLYDLLVSSGIFASVLNVIEKTDWEDIQHSVTYTIDNVYQYKNSVMGILDTVLTDYGTMDLDATSIQEKIADPNNLALLKGIMDKLG